MHPAKKLRGINSQAAQLSNIGPSRWIEPWAPFWVPHPSLAASVGMAKPIGRCWTSLACVHFLSVMTISIQAKDLAELYSSIFSAPVTKAIHFTCRTRECNLLLLEFLKFLSQKSMKELEFHNSFYGQEKKRESTRENYERGEKRKKNHPSSPRYAHKFFNNLITVHFVLWF